MNKRSYRDPVSDMMASAFNDLLEFRKHQTQSPTQNEKEEQFNTLELGKRGHGGGLKCRYLRLDRGPDDGPDGCKKGLDGVSDASTCTLAFGRLTA